MARPPLPIGTWGKIRRNQLSSTRWQARARFRDYDGVTRDVEAWGATGAAAERALLEKLSKRTISQGEDITADTRISRIAELWLDEITAEGRLAPQSIDSYRGYVRSVLPALGGLRIRECVVSRLDRFFKTTAATHPTKAKHAKGVVGQMLAMAVRHGALTTNPVREVGRIRKPRRRVRALSADDLARVRAAIRQWQAPQAGTPGPHHSNDLADIVDVLLATGARIGEAVALLATNLDFEAERPTLTFSGTIVYVKGKGYFRQEWTKSHAGYRTVTLPRFAVETLRWRLIAAATTTTGALFSSRKGTWLSPANVRRQWRQARKDTGLEWVVPHTFRKTVATLIDRESSTKAAAGQLGHASEEITNTYYIEKPHVAPDSSELLETLGAGSPRTDPE